MNNSRLIFLKLISLVLPHRKFRIQFINQFQFFPLNVALYKQAFRHRSAGKNYFDNNERLEFLGDSVIEMIVSDYLFSQFQRKDEGSLSRLRSSIVSRETLNELAVKMNFQIFIHYDQSIRLKQGETPNLYGNAFEAFIGAIYLDRGYHFSRKFLLMQILIPKLDVQELGKTELNYKGKLYELSQKKQFNLKFLVEESGPRDNPTYFVRVLIDNEIMGEGTASRKKKAEQIASCEAINSITKQMKN